MTVNRDVYRNFLEQQRQALENEVRADFDFKNDLRAFIDTKYPTNAEMDMVREMNAEYKQALVDKEIEKLTKLAQRLENHINYITEKSRDDDEQRKNLIKMNLLLEELNKLIASGEEKRIDRN